MQLGDVGMEKAAASLQGRQLRTHPALSEPEMQLRESSAD